MDFQKGRRGLSPYPVDGWPLDGLMVGAATTRTLRQLFGTRGRPSRDEPIRAWDVALWSGVTPQGCRHCMERIAAAGLLRPVAPAKSWHAATYRIECGHPLVGPLATLFRVERRLAGPLRGINGRPVGGWTQPPALDSRLKSRVGDAQSSEGMVGWGEKDPVD